MKLTAAGKAAYGIGAVGKDMVYALSASYVLYYYQDLLGMRATFVGTILMAARVFDAVNDPFMGVLVAKTHTRWGRFRPWLFTGTVLNAFVLYALFAAPVLPAAGLMVYFAVTYLLWGITYTMMDIPYWSMIPAVAETPADREKLSVISRTCAGIGSALISMGAMLLVERLGNGDERRGFRLLALAVAVLFVLTESICCRFVKEKAENAHRSATVQEMFRALLRNDQAIVVVVTIVLINMSLYLSFNFVIYFFKYDFGGDSWRQSYTLYNTLGGVFQILGMTVVYPLLRRARFQNQRIFVFALVLAMLSCGLLFLIFLLELAHNLLLLLLPGLLLSVANGILAVLTTLFLSATVDYGELLTGNREESVIFSLQTFVVKAASGAAVFLTGIGLDGIGLSGGDTAGAALPQSAAAVWGLRLWMTLAPLLGLFPALLFFRKRFRLTDAYAAQVLSALQNHHKE